MVFYDYDEICYLTDVNFGLCRRLTTATKFSAETWAQRRSARRLSGGVRRFLFGRPGIKRLFTQMHGELFDPHYWQGLQRAIATAK